MIYLLLYAETESVVKTRVASVFKKLKNPWILGTVCPISRDVKHALTKAIKSTNWTTRIRNPDEYWNSSNAGALPSVVNRDQSMVINRIWSMD